MPSAWILTRTTKSGEKCYQVRYRLGGRESTNRHAGSFKRKADADERKRWLAGELAARRVPDLGSLEEGAAAGPTFAATAQRWLASRLDDSDGTRVQHRTSVNRAIRVLGTRPIDEISAADVAAMIAELHGEGLKPGYLRKIAQATAMVFDHAGMNPNPARDKLIVRLPRQDRAEVQPPTAAHVLAVHGLLPSVYRLPLLTLDATGMRLGELEQLEWGDVDEGRGRWRVSAAVSKSGRARWVKVHPAVFAAVLELCPRDDRTPTRRVFLGFGGDRFRTAITRACTAVGVPAFSPHDLRHRRISLLHLGGVPWARIGEQVGQRSLAVTADTYTHVLVDEDELDYAVLLKPTMRARMVGAPVGASAAEKAD
jgi:integrase